MQPSPVNLQNRMERRDSPAHALLQRRIQLQSLLGEKHVRKEEEHRLSHLEGFPDMVGRQLMAIPVRDMDPP